jgi:uncharacterized membrane protein YhaH (DUF805 family)
MFKYFIGAFKKYVIFSGRARRAEYWGFHFFFTLFSIVMRTIDRYFEWDYLLEGIYVLVSFLPTLGVVVRRCHDVNKRAWWMLVPIYGWFIISFLAGTVGPNSFGPDPKDTPQDMLNNLLRRHKK